jgi:hypothetical protein
MMFATLVAVSNHVKSSVVRRAARAVALTPAVLVGTVAAPALASPPAQWGPQPSVDPLHALLVYLIIPGGLFLLITLLVYVPSMARGQKYQPGLAWRNEPEWFGGPSGGVEAAENADQAAAEGESGQRGGASARW